MDAGFVRCPYGEDHHGIRELRIRQINLDRVRGVKSFMQDIAYNADDRFPWAVRVAHSKALADGIFAGPKLPGHPFVDNGDHR